MFESVNEISNTNINIIKVNLAPAKLTYRNENADKMLKVFVVCIALFYGKLIHLMKHLRLR